jgi:integrase
VSYFDSGGKRRQLRSGRSECGVGDHRRGAGVRIVRKPTKRADWRDVPLTDAAVAAFLGQWAQRCELLRAEPIGDSYVFPGGIDPVVPMRPERLQNRWVAAREPSPVTLGHLRHYACDGHAQRRRVIPHGCRHPGHSESTLRVHYDGRTDAGKRKAIAALELGSPASRRS